MPAKEITPAQEIKRLKPVWLVVAILLPVVGLFFVPWYVCLAWFLIANIAFGALIRKLEEQE